MGFAEFTLREFVDVLASGNPVPGGGGASALAGAVGTALANMVGSLTVGKKKYADVEDRMIELKRKCDELQEEFLRLSDRDAEVFTPLAEAYRLPRETQEQRDRKDQVMEEALRNACMVPLEIMEKACEAIALVSEFAEKGSVMAVSDAAAAAVICRAALQGASLNVYINTRSMKDRACAETLNRRADGMLSEWTAAADKIYDQVMSRLKEGR